MDKHDAPKVGVVVLGYNHADDSVECLRSILGSTYPNMFVLYVDNGSEESEARRVLLEVPEANAVRFRDNVGVGNGFNAGLAYALKSGADYVFMINNDTKTDVQAISRLVEAAEEDSRVGVVVPKIFYYDYPDTIWSAGSRYRRFPPAVIIRKTVGPDDGRYDNRTGLKFACFCAALLRCNALEKTGLLDPSYHVFYEDYDMCIRMREAGYGVFFAPQAHVWHKVSRSTKAGTPNPDYWRIYGRAEGIFCRKHRRRYRWLTSPVHRIYVILRILAERKHYGVVPFVKGLQEGLRVELTPPPRWDEEPVGNPEVFTLADVNR